MKLKAFTLIEVLLTIVIISLSMGLVISWTGSILNSASLQTTAEELVSVLRNQQSSAANARENSSHGVEFAADRYTTFEGENADSSPSTHFVKTMAQNLSLAYTLTGGGDEIIFKKGTGETDQYGSVTLTHSKVDDPITISISPLGLIDWQ